MKDIKQEHKISFKNKYYVLTCLAVALLGVAIFRNKFPALRSELTDTLFIATLLVTSISVFRGRE